jgi:hypothetical protein
VPYFPVVFPLPHGLNPLCQRHPRLLYDLLFHASAQTMLEVAADPRHLGARIGFLSILHTWGQNLRLHPHLHCVIPAGGFDSGYRTGFIPGMPSSCREGAEPCLPRQVPRSAPARTLAAPHRLSFCPSTLVRAQLKDDWVVYAKPAFGDPVRGLSYLAIPTAWRSATSAYSASTVTAYASDGKTTHMATSSAS